MSVVRELSVIALLPLLASAYCFLFCRESSKLNMTFIYANICDPITSFLMPKNSLMARFIVGKCSPVLHIFAPRNLPQIDATIVKRVVINMIWNLSIRAPKENSFHLRSPMRLSGVKRLRASIPLGYPIPRHKEIVIGRINDGHLMARESDISNRLILRLDNRFAVNAIFGHDSTSNGIAVFNRVLILSGS